MERKLQRQKKAEIDITDIIKIGAVILFGFLALKALGVF